MRVGIIGANGYGGAELLRFLYHHPYAKVAKIVSNTTKGKLITELYPHLHDFYNLVLEKADVDEIVSQVELLFFATPSGVSKELIPLFLEKGIKCIDMSGDFRLKEANQYEQWYKHSPANVHYLQKAVYGLTEVFRNEIKNAELIANPGCFPTAALLGLMPALKNRIIKPNSIIVDAKTGVSGAGRNAAVGNIFSEVNENVKAYKVGSHQHTPEIEQIITKISGSSAHITFTTHLMPMTRGIMCTMYSELTDDLTGQEIHELYKEVYKDEPFVRVRNIKEFPSTKEVMGSNFCDIGVFADERTNRLTIVSVIDNLVKGAAGQAIQNLNLINEWEEQSGLNTVPIYP